MLTTNFFTQATPLHAPKMASGRRQSLSVNRLVRFGVLSSVLLTNLVAGQDCSPERYNNCTVPFSANDLNDAVVPWYSQAVVTEVCTRYQAYVTCMRTVIPYCDTKQALLYKGLVDGYQYLCNSGFDDYVVYQPCFSDPDVQSETMSCSDGLSSKILAINSTDQVYIRKRICQYSDNYMSCVYNALTSFCNMGAATWQQTFDLKQLCPLLTQLACSEWSSQCSALNNGNGVTATTTAAYSSSLPNWLVIVLGVTISFTAVLVFVAVVAVVVARIRISKRHSRRPSSTTIPVRGENPRIGLELPPPYPGPLPQTLFVPPTAPVAPLEIAAGGATNDAFVPPEENFNNGKKFASFNPSTNQETVFKSIDQSAGHFVPDAIQFNDQTSDVIPVSLLPPALQRTVQRQNQSSSDADTWDSTSSMLPAARKLATSSRPLSPSHGLTIRDTLASPTLSEASSKFSGDPFLRAASPSSGSAFAGGSVDSGHARILPHGVGSRSPSSTSPTSGVVANPFILHQQQQQLPLSLQDPSPFPPFHMAVAGGGGGRQDHDVELPTVASSASAGETMTFSDSLDYY